mmetsp:Transcript_25029/g.74679  ORF Transcript_25029/g.74679 Transcript_25029/m.74679 type:complete len:197 (+) Transcript_25029:75-665(+)
MPPPPLGTKFKPVLLKNNGITSAVVSHFDGAAAAREDDLRVSGVDGQTPADKVYSVGLKLQRECNFDGAIAMFRAALKQDPAHADAQYHLDLALAMTDEEKRARKKKLLTGRDSPPTPMGISPVVDFDALDELEAAAAGPSGGAGGEDDDDEDEVIDVPGDYEPRSKESGEAPAADALKGVQWGSVNQTLSSLEAK